MDQLPYFRMFPKDHLGETAHLSTIEHGAHVLLMLAAWRSDGQILPNDDKLLARYARMTAGQWRRVRPVLEGLWRVSSDGWTHSHLTKEVEAVRQKSESGRANARARWLKDNDSTNATAMRPQCENDAYSEHRTQNLDNTPLKPPRKRGGDYTPAFEQFWEAYPRRTAKRKAFTAWQKAIKRADPDTIAAGVLAYRQCERVRSGFVQHAATWLNGDGWLDEHSDAAAVNGEAAAPELDYDAILRNV